MVCRMVQRMATLQLFVMEQFEKLFAPAGQQPLPFRQEEKLSGYIENTSCWLKKASRSRGTDWLFEKDDLRERITC